MSQINNHILKIVTKIDFKSPYLSSDVCLGSNAPSCGLNTDCNAGTCSCKPGYEGSDPLNSGCTGKFSTKFFIHCLFSFIIVAVFT